MNENYRQVAAGSKDASRTCHLPPRGLTLASRLIAVAAGCMWVSTSRGLMPSLRLRELGEKSENRDIHECSIETRQGYLFTDTLING